LDQLANLLGDSVVRVAAEDGLIAVGANGYHIKRGLQQLAKTLDVTARLRREVGPASRTGDVGLPAGELLVLRIHALKDGEIGGDVAEVGIVDFVGGADLDGLHLVEGVEAGEGDSCEPV
jgi:hypothetical protein